MSRYRRARTKGGTYFFTVATYRRRPIFTNDAVAAALRQAIREVKQNSPFIINAWVLLPDHMHCIWTLPLDDIDYSKRMGRIKSKFTSLVKERFHKPNWMTQSKHSKRESTIWQRRFWEHEIRDERDFHNHMDYVHFNPVKHGLVENVVDWPFSTFHKYVKAGIYPANWVGMSREPPYKFGE